MSVVYRYAEGDLLKEPNTYAYSQYEGEAFIKAWRRSRQAALDELPQAAVSANPQGRVGGEDTRSRLEALWQGLTGHDDEALPELDGLLQRFEVSKRIHGRYTPDWHPINWDDHLDLDLYIRFAELLELAYKKKGTLNYLNALLKCLDVLAAMRSNLSDPEGERLARLIARERLFVDALAARVEQDS